MIVLSTVGIIVNPNAGKDIRRMVSAASHSSDAVKISIVRRVIAGAAESGAGRILLSADPHRLAERAADGLDAPVEVVQGPTTGSHLDSANAAQAMRKADAGAVVAVGGDGTCRDVANGWPDVPLIAISTGTNNVFPSTLDGTTAGVAAALVATGTVRTGIVTVAAKRITLRIDDPAADGPIDEHALVEAALIDTPFVGARAISDPATIRWVIASIADPAATGLASIAGRIHQVDRWEPGGVIIGLGAGGRRVRVPLTPGTFVTIDVNRVDTVDPAAPVELTAEGVLAYDGERTTPVSAGTVVTASIDTSGPRMIDVGRAVALAAADRRFDVEEAGDGN